MDFVTKEQFEKAIAVLKKAVENGQVYKGAGEDTEQMVSLFFSNNLGGYGSTLISANHASFTSPLQAARNKVHSVRNSLKTKNEVASKTKDEVTKLEQELQKLASLIQTLKE